MKSYKEVAENVIRRSEQIIEKNNRRKRAAIRVGSAACCLTAAGAVGLGVRANVRGNMRDALSVEQFAIEGDHSGMSDTVVVDVGGGDTSVNSPDVGSVPQQTEMPSGNAVGNMPIMSADSMSADSYTGSTWDFGNLRTVIKYHNMIDYEPPCPVDGAYIISPTLSGAMDEYGDKDENGNDIIYAVDVEFFSGGAGVAADSGEIVRERERLRELGYSGGFETLTADWGNIVRHWVWLNLTAEQIESFPAGDYGYILSLYCESHEGCDESYNVVFGGNYDVN